MRDYRQIYAHDAARYDRLVSAEDAAGALPATLARVACLTPGDRVVELGAGTGRVTRLIAPYVAHVDAFDEAEAMLVVARERAAAAGHLNCTFTRAEHRALPVADGSADVALAGWAIAHAVAWHPDTWRDHVRAALAEMRRVVRPGGHVVVVETLGTGAEEPAPPPHLLPLYELLERGGFSRETIRTDYRFASPAEALELVGFFFGERLATPLAASLATTLPECTGVWHLSLP